MRLEGLSPGTVFAADYVIVKPLSEGGMGELYVVQQISTGAHRALKLMHIQMAQNPKLRQRFEQEARVGALIESDHVVQVIGAGIDDASGLPWLSMELLQGEDLSHVIARRGALPHDEVRAIFAQLTHAVAAAHRVGIVHRDLKPENIFLSAGRREGAALTVKVLDFGIAKVMAEASTTATQAIGTPAWMAPEQTEASKVIGPPCDVWALGLIAFRMLTGAHFWATANLSDATPAMVLRETVFDAIPTPTVRASEMNLAHRLPPGFDVWFARCVNRTPAARFPNATEVRDAFEHLFVGEFRAAQVTSAVTGPGNEDFGRAFGTAPHERTIPVQFTPPGPVPSPGLRSTGRKAKAPWVVGGASALCFVALVGAGLGLRARSRSNSERECAAGTTTAGDRDRALSACRAACNSSPSKFCTQLGDLTRAGPDERLQDEAGVHYGAACDAGDPLGCRKLGSLYEVGRGSFQKSSEKALELYKKSCDARDPSGCAFLARRIEKGKGIERDRGRATAMYEKACSGGDPASCAILGFSRENGPQSGAAASDIEAFYKRALPALQRECDGGGLLECVELGTLLQRGKGVAQDIPAAQEAFRRACRGSLEEGCANGVALGLLVAGDPNGSNAVAALQKACSGGVAAACNNLGMLLANVPFALRQDQGVSVFKAVCGDTLSTGCTQRGPMVTLRSDVAKDLAAAVTKLSEACSEGEGIACANLGALQENGVGTAHDAGAARSSYQKACTLGALDGCSSMNADPFVEGEVWHGTYTCAQGSTDLSLRIVDASSDRHVTAIFDFDYPYRGSHMVGQFLVSGVFDAGHRSITLAAGPWLNQPAGWSAVGLTGVVSLQGTVFTGAIDAPSCGKFRVARLASEMVEPRCDSGSTFREGHGCVRDPASGPTVLGTWTGKGVQLNGSSWTMKATLKSLEVGRCGAIEYPSLTCGGEWYCFLASDGKTLRAREIITRNTSRCDSTGFVDMTLLPDGQTADWRWMNRRQVFDASARLSRSNAD